MNEIEIEWNSGGNDVKIAGTFNNWQPINMIKYENKWIHKITQLDNDFTFKFIVDGEWKIDENKEKIIDENGNINNIIKIQIQKFIKKEIKIIKEIELSDKIKIKEIFTTIKEIEDQEMKIKKDNELKKLNYEKDLKLMLKKEIDKEKLNKKLEIDRLNQIKKEKETIILINENLNYLKMIANCIKNSNFTELDKCKARREYFMDILERDYPHVVPRLTLLPNVDFSNFCNQYEILPQKVYIIDGQFKFTYMYDDILNK